MKHIGDILCDVPFMAFIDPLEEHEGFALAISHQQQNEDDPFKTHFRKMQYFKEEKRWGATRSGIALYKGEIKDLGQCFREIYLASLGLNNALDRAFLLSAGDELAFHKKVTHISDIDLTLASLHENGRMSEHYVDRFKEDGQKMSKEEADLFLRRHYNHLRNVAYLRILDDMVDAFNEQEEESYNVKPPLPTLASKNTSVEEAKGEGKRKGKKRRMRYAGTKARLAETSSSSESEPDTAFAIGTATDKRKTT